MLDDTAPQQEAPDQGGVEPYADCKHCRGYGFFTVEGQNGQTTKATCGNCAERRRWEGLSREPQNKWCVWTKTGRRPSVWHNTPDEAEREAARLARKYPGKTFIVFAKLVNIRTVDETGSDGD